MNTGSPNITTPCIRTRIGAVLWAFLSSRFSWLIRMGPRSKICGLTFVFAIPCGLSCMLNARGRCISRGRGLVGAWSFRDHFGLDHWPATIFRKALGRRVGFIILVLLPAVVYGDIRVELLNNGREAVLYGSVAPHQLTPRSTGRDEWIDLTYHGPDGRYYRWIEPGVPGECATPEAAAQRLNKALGVRLGVIGNDGAKNYMYAICGDGYNEYWYEQYNVAPPNAKSCAVSALDEVRLSASVGGSGEQARGRVLVDCSSGVNTIRVTIGSTTGSADLDLGEGLLVSTKVCPACGNSYTSSIEGVRTFEPVFTVVSSGSRARTATGTAIFTVEVL